MLTGTQNLVSSIQSLIKRISRRTDTAILPLAGQDNVTLEYSKPGKNALEGDFICTILDEAHFKEK